MGRPKGSKNKQPPNYEKLFFSKVVELPNGCWQWQGRTTKQGYGEIDINLKPVKAHRYAYELFNGPIPKGLVINHFCRNTGCVNPAHMELVTHEENSRRGYPGPRSQEREAENPPFDVTTLTR